MAWRGSTDAKDRIFAALVYLIPLYSAIPFGTDLFQQFPFLRVILIPLQPLALIYGLIPFGNLVVFFVLFLAVVRNEKIPHFIRFNTMQAILVDIALSLLSVLFFRIIGPGILPSLITVTIFNVIFTVVLAACIYSIVQSAMGRYAEIPAISEAVYTQVP
ncbi:Tic20 family protein [Hyella patelloides LEGE 07179]|uniref:Tic20 family protein n=1 Tax=Hyella patelloides LEGE 07179 TaxID=945734 RepID=A0A563VW58_9CYAN|nr:Tic20 family protein [Hyella patelloides]VEP15689.1 Tic20 family protein [Hyella patelloides LEGE 07179]